MNTTKKSIKQITTQTHRQSTSRKNNNATNASSASTKNRTGYFPKYNTNPNTNPNIIGNRYPSHLIQGIVTLVPNKYATYIPGSVTEFTEKVKTIDIPIDSLIRYWASPVLGILFVEDIYYMKQRLLESDPCYIIENHFPYYKISDAYKSHYTQICLIVTWIGILSNALYNKSICCLLIKGGKAIQHALKKRIAEYESSDIDIVIVPMGNSNSDVLLKMGQNISRFLQWACTYEHSVPFFSVLQFDDDQPILHKSIIKISIKPENQGYLALLDIGIGYHELSPFIKWLYSHQNEQTEFYIEFIKMEGKFIYQNLYDIVMEKMYYIIKYSSPEEIINVDNIRFLRKSHDSLNILLSQASMATSTKKTTLITQYLDFILDFMRIHEGLQEVDKDRLYKTISRPTISSNIYEYYV